MDAADYIARKLIEEPGDLRGVPPVVLRECVRMAVAYTEDLLGRLDRHSETTECDALHGAIVPCERCGRVALEDDAQMLGWGEDRLGATVCAHCYEMDRAV